MNSFEIQKVISAILITILVVFGIGKISNFFFNKDPGPVVAYKVDAPEGSEKIVKKIHNRFKCYVCSCRFSTW